MAARDDYVAIAISLFREMYCSLITTTRAVYFDECGGNSPHHPGDGEFWNTIFSSTSVGYGRGVGIKVFWV